MASFSDASCASEITPAALPIIGVLAALIVPNVLDRTDDARATLQRLRQQLNTPLGDIRTR